MNYVSIIRRQTLWTAVLFFCLAALTLGANPFSGETVAPMDLLQILPGWSESRTVEHAVNWQPADIIDGQLPLWFFMKERMRGGHLPLWYPYGAGGEAVAMELWNPTFLLFSVVKDHALAYYLVGLFKLFIAGFGGYLLVRIFTGWLPAVWSGIAYMLCGFNTAWFFWEHVATSPWIPWLLWATVRYLKDEDRSWLPVISIVTLLMLVSGFPPVAAFGLYSFGLLILVWTICAGTSVDARFAISVAALKQSVQRVVWPFAAVGIAFLMAGAVFIPFVDIMSGFNLSSRIGMTDFSNGLRDLVLFLDYERPLTVERTAYMGSAVVLFAGIGVISLFRETNFPARTFLLFTVLLIGLSVPIAFGLLPSGLIRAIPVFGSNAWNRFIVIPQLGLSILAGFGMELLLDLLLSWTAQKLPGRIMVTRILMALVLVVLASHWYSHKIFFREYNTVVPSSWLYPVTPNISYVKSHLRPLQSVIADDSYGFSGALGAYGISEWYAHSFRTDKEKEVLGRMVNEPFITNTAALIGGNKIRFDSSLMDKLGIKYVFLNKHGVGEQLMLGMREVMPALAPPLPENAWKQHIMLHNDTVLSAIGFLFTTYGAPSAPADIRLTIGRSDGVVCQQEPVLKKETIRDNQWAYFEFIPRLPLAKGEYVLHLSFDNKGGKGRVSATTTSGYEQTGNYLAVNGRDTDASLNMRMVLQQKNDLRKFGDRWRIIDLEPDVYVLENKKVTGSAYFVSSLDASNDQIDFSGIHVTSPAPDLIRIEHTMKDEGWIVLPKHLDRGWKASVDGRDVAYDAYLDILPAIPVKGAGTIVFRYQPASFRYGLAVSIFGAGLFLLFMRFCLKQGRPA